MEKRTIVEEKKPEVIVLKGGNPEDWQSPEHKALEDEREKVTTQIATLESITASLYHRIVEIDDLLFKE